MSVECYHFAMSEHQSTSQAQASSSVTVTLNSDEPDTHTQDLPTFRLKLRKPKSTKKVNWTEETVDNENMDKKKSKCCCIYQKPRAQDESSSDEDSDECEHCYGHVEKKKSVLKKHNNTPSPDPGVQNSL